MSKTIIERWTVNELIDATSANPQRGRKVTIPEFQRRLVWNRKKREMLIDSIKKGYPFGSLLMYKETDETGEMEHYKLIDGLQRTQALRHYASSPNSSFTKADLSDELIELAAQELERLAEPDSLPKKLKPKVQGVMLKWIWGSQGFSEADGWVITGLVNALIKEILELEEDTYEFYTANRELLSENRPFQIWVTDFLNSLRKESDIGKAEVPIIIFTGPARELPTVFELLNTQGAKLTRYEIFAAQWLDHRRPIKNEEIIDAIWKKYAALEKHGFTLDVAQKAPDEQSRLERHYTLFEYLFGLGQYLSQKYPHLFRAVQVDQPSSAGFNLMAACLGLHTASEMEKLPDAIHGLNLTTLEAYLLESVGFVNNTMQPALSLHPYEQTKISYYHTELQIISMIATAFQTRYNKNDLSVSKDWEDKRGELRKHIPMYYLYDILRNNWVGSGRNRLYDMVSNERYLKPPLTKALWLQALSVWFNSHINNRHHAIRYVKDDYPEYLLLRYIYARRFSKANTQTYHLYHIMPIVQLLAPPSFYSEFYGPINTIGNLALLEQADDIAQGDRTFVEELNRRRSNGTFSVGQYRDELRKYEKLLICKADDLPSELTQSAFESFLRQRFERLKAAFIHAWQDCIPTE